MRAIKSGLLALSVLAVMAQLQGCDPTPDAQSDAAASAASAASAVGVGASQVVVTSAEPESLPANASGPVVGEGGNAVAVVREVQGGLKVGGGGPVVAYYPGAKENVARGTKEPIPGGNMITVLLDTRDPIDKVTAYYRQQLKSGWPSQSINEQANGEDAVVMSASSLEGDKTVMISIARSEDDGKGTAISILTATKVLEPAQ